MQLDDIHANCGDDLFPILKFFLFTEHNHPDGNFILIDTCLEVAYRRVSKLTWFNGDVERVKSSYTVTEHDIESLVTFVDIRGNVNNGRYRFSTVRELNDEEKAFERGG